LVGSSNLDLEGIDVWGRQVALGVDPGDPVFIRRVNGWLTIFWIVMIPISIATGWISSVTYVAALSLWALVSGHWAAWQAARVDVKQEQEAKQRDKTDIPTEVVKRIAEETSVQSETERAT
jgi:hypothetical protein